MSKPVAYEWAGMTFCPTCALASTNLGLMVSGIRAAADMDEAIATMALAQIERGRSVETPVAVMETELAACENCGSAFEREEVA